MVLGLKQGGHKGRPYSSAAYGSVPYCNPAALRY